MVYKLCQSLKHDHLHDGMAPVWRGSMIGIYTVLIPMSLLIRFLAAE